MQLELGIFLRTRGERSGYTIQFERNVSFFSITGTIKHEIDIVIFNLDKTEKFAIELKFPKNGQYPEQMYSFIKDIVFMEQLKKYGFTETYTLTLVDDPLFYESGRKKSGIYKYFRGEVVTIKGKISKPTSSSGPSSLSATNSYSINWKSCYLGKYYIIEIK